MLATDGSDKVESPESYELKSIRKKQVITPPTQKKKQ